jgi:hypothetical protein
LLFHGLRASFVHPHPLRRGTRRRHGGFRRFHLKLEFAVVKPCEQLAGLNTVILIHQHFRQPFLNAWADNGLDTRFERPGAHHFARNRTGAYLMAQDGHRRESEAVGDDHNNRCRQGQLEDRPGSPGKLKFHDVQPQPQAPGCAALVPAGGAAGPCERLLANRSSRAMASRPMDLSTSANFSLNSFWSASVRTLSAIGKTITSSFQMWF